MQAKAPKITRRYNKDGSVSYVALGRVVLRIRNVLDHASVIPFLEGWFGTADRKQWNIGFFVPAQTGVKSPLGRV